MQWLINSWYKQHPIRWFLSPLSALYRIIIWIRKNLYQRGILKQHHLTVPVIIVGNISVGGTGKTPTVIWLAKQLQKAGYKPGIISRGYGGKADHYPLAVTAQSDSNQVGDEPIIISRQTACPMVVAPNRIAAGKMLLDHYHCDIIISDDGLQHYALQREIEIIIVDGNRGFGNQYCLPAGPLREPLSRMNSVDFIIYNGGHDNVDYTMQLIQKPAVNLVQPTLTKDISEFNSQQVHAIAGIGNPQQFFDQLTQYGLNIIPHPFADHQPFQHNDINFNDDKAILMTEKDAVKCQHFANKNMWYIPIEVAISGKLEQHLLDKLAGLTPHG